MIKIKITPFGGYVVGDGPCPFDPDDFMMAYLDRINEARRAGLTELGIPDELIDKINEVNKQVILNTPAMVIEEPKKKLTIKELLEYVPDRTEV
jgi:hypothetical protein